MKESGECVGWVWTTDRVCDFRRKDVLRPLLLCSSFNDSCSSSFLRKTNFFQLTPHEPYLLCSSFLFPLPVSFLGFDIRTCLEGRRNQIKTVLVVGETMTRRRRLRSLERFLLNMFVLSFRPLLPLHPSPHCVTDNLIQRPPTETDGERPWSFVIRVCPRWRGRTGRTGLT